MTVIKAKMTHIFVVMWVAVVAVGAELTETDKAQPRVKKDDDNTTSAADIKWKIVTIENAPYTYKKGDDFSGFIPDLLKLISKRVGFEYTLSVSADGRYGVYNNGRWTGMIGEVIDKKVDMAAAPITITRQREKVIDFVMPFQNLGLAIVVKKPHMADDVKTTWLFNFSIFAPLEPEVWALITVSSIVVAVVLWLMNRFNPYDYGSRLERGLSTEEDAESFNLSGSLWFVFTTLQWQGYDRAPRSVASKVLGVVWFTFVTLTLVTYTASIVNHLFWDSTVHGKDPTKSPIRDLEDLIMSPDYNYGTIRDGSTFTYLTDVARGEEFDILRKYLYSEKGDTMLASSSTQGIEWVRTKKNYAFIMESMQARHEVNNPANGVCDLTLADKTFGSRSYGFALPHNSPHREQFHHAILDAAESGDLEYLEKKWWVDMGKCWNETRLERMVSDVTAVNINKPKRVNLPMFYGALILMCLGVFVSILVCVAEMLFFKYRGRYSNSNRARMQTHASEPNQNLE